jgi:hypothetical protein
MTSLGAGTTHRNEDVRRGRSCRSSPGTEALSRLRLRRSVALWKSQDRSASDSRHYQNGSRPDLRPSPLADCVSVVLVSRAAPYRPAGKGDQENQQDQSHQGHCLAPQMNASNRCLHGSFPRSVGAPPGRFAWAPLPVERAWAKEERRHKGSARVGTPKTSGSGDRLSHARFRGNLRGRVPVLPCPPYALRVLKRPAHQKHAVRSWNSEAGCRPTGRLCAPTPRCAYRGGLLRAGVGGDNRSRLRPARAERGVGSIRAQTRPSPEVPSPTPPNRRIEALAPSWAGRGHQRGVHELPILGAVVSGCSSSSRA